MTRIASSSLRLRTSLAAVAATLTLSSGAWAQGVEPDAPPEDGAIEDMGDEDEALAVDEPAAEDAEAPAEEAEEEDVVIDHERKPDGSTQLLMGARYRMMITPKFLINMFGVEGGRTVIVHGVGPEIGGYFGETADGFMILASVWHAWYGLDTTPFKGKSDDDSAWEVIESDMGVWYLTGDAMWDHKLIDKLSLNLGIGFGIGFVRGDFRRNEAYRDPEGRYDADGTRLSICEQPGDPNAEALGVGGDCPGGSDTHYNIADGGKADRWPVYPWLNFQTGLRYQATDDFVGRLDIGLGSSGFWLGLGADYSLFL